MNRFPLPPTRLKKLMPLCVKERGWYVWKICNRNECICIARALYEGSFDDGLLDEDIGLRESLSARSQPALLAMFETKAFIPASDGRDSISIPNSTANRHAR